MVVPGDNVGFNGINIQEVTHQFWLAGVRGCGFAGLGRAPPVCVTAFETHHLVRPPPNPLKDKTIALIDIQIARGPGLPSTQPGVCHSW